jgi:PhnB protein
MEFYKSVFGGELTVMTFGQGGMTQDAGDKDKIMHAQLVAPNGYWLMGSDTPPNMEFRPGTTMTVSLSGDDGEALRGYWNKLAEGAKVAVPLAKAPWGDTFGMLTDKFGTPWMVNITGA